MATAAGRLNGTIIAADCDGWPFAGHTIATPFAVADFDAYAYPYASFRAWWESDAPRADRLVVFFTDAQRQSVYSQWHHIRPFGINSRRSRLTT